MALGALASARSNCSAASANFSSLYASRPRSNASAAAFSSAGVGSAPHLASVGFEAAAGIKFTTVQFKGGGPASQSLIAGETQVMFATSPTVMGFIKGGRMRPLMISMKKNSPAIPGIPGSEEAGLPNFESTFSFGLYAPAGTPMEIVRRLHAAAAKGLAKPEIRETPKKSAPRAKAQERMKAAAEAAGKAAEASAPATETPAQG